MIKKILIANRGEIAVRVIRTAKKMGIRTVAVYSEVDRDSLHVGQADEAVCIGEVELSETYLNIPKIIETAKTTHCDAIHPGYGFLAENPAFVSACDKAGIIFIGPNVNSMQIMGNKIESREFVKKTGVPVTAGITGSKEVLIKSAHTIGFPVLLKAAAGGGGKGMRIVEHEDELAEAIESTSRQAKAYFADDTVYIEKFIRDPRHIEVQILGDNFGNVIHLFERECSIQRRYQKIIEESPSPTLTPEVRQKICDAAVKIGKEISYNNAGTIEFLVDKSLNFYFLEMNTRVQVEHPVTELVTGTDIVEEQILIASGKKLALKQKDIRQHGHAIECRIYAEDPSHNFRPSPGKMTLYKEPEMPGIRIDTGITPDTEIKSFFDPMICKLIVWGEDREQAKNKMEEALGSYLIHGIKTNISYLKQLMHSPEFSANAISTRFCDEHTEQLIAGIQAEKEKIPKHIPVIGYLLSSLSKNDFSTGEPAGRVNLWETIGYWRDLMQITINLDDEELQVLIPEYSKNRFLFQIFGNRYEIREWSCTPDSVTFLMDNHRHSIIFSEDKEGHVFLSLEGHLFILRRMDTLTETFSPEGFERSGGDNNHITSPMPGKVIKINVQEGDQVKKGGLLMIIEAMKMENMILSPLNGKVGKINVSVNDRVEISNPLLHLVEEAD